MAEKNVVLNLIVKAVNQGTEALRVIKVQIDEIGRATQTTGTAATDMGNKLQAGLQAADKTARDLKNRLNDIGATLVGAGASLAGMGAGLVAPIAAAVKTSAGLEQQINNMRAVADEMTEAQVGQITDKVRQLGATTKFTAEEAAGAMVEIARAGYTTDQALSTIGPVLNLAAAEGTEMRQVAESLVNILNSFGMSADQAGRAADVLAHTSNASTSSMAELSEGLKFVATNAASLGMSIEEVSAYLGVFSNNGLRGAMAGTALRGLLARLTRELPQAKEGLAELGVEVAKTADGNVNLTETMKRLSSTSMTFTQAVKIFGTEGATAALVASKNAQAIQDLTVKNEKAGGSLQKMAEIMMSGTSAQFKKFTSAVNDLLITLGTPLLGTISAVLKKLAEFFNGLSAFGKEHPVIAAFLGYFIGGLGLLAIAAGGTATALGLLFIAVTSISKGWGVLIDLKNRLLQLMGGSATAIRAETAAITAQTQAVNALAAANQRAIDSHKGPVWTGRSGASTPPTVPTPAPTPSGGRFSAAGTLGAAAVGAGIAALSGAEAWDVAKWAALSAGMQLVATNAGVLAAKLWALVPSWSAVTSVFSLFGTALKGVGVAIAAFAASPVAIVAGTIATILGTIAGGYKVLSDRKEAADIQAETIKRAKSDLDRAIKEGFDPKKSPQLVNTIQLGEDPYEELLKKRKQATAEYAGYSAQLAESKEKDAQSWLGGKSKDTTAAEIGAETSRRNLDAITQEINKRLDQKKAVEAVGREHEKLEEIKKGAIKTEEKLLEESKNRADLELKLIQDSAKSRDDLNKIELEQAKVRISATIQSEIQAKQEIDRLTISSSGQRIAIAQSEFEQTRESRNRAYAEQKAIYEKQIADGSKAIEAKKNLAELEKLYTENQITDSRKLTEVVVQEINNQIKAKEDQVKKVKDLEKQLRDEQSATRDALVQVTLGSVNEFTKLQLKIGEVSGKLKEATSLAPTMPEKALELFKQVRSESAGLVQDIEGFNQKLRDVAYGTQDAIRKIKNTGLEGADKYRAEIEDIQEIFKRAADAEAVSRFKDAENLYKQAQSMAQGLTSSAVKTGNAATDKANLEAAKNDALNIVMQANNGLTTVVEKQKAQAEVANKLARENIEKADKAIQDLIKAQIKSAQDLINALDANTVALQGRLAQTDQAKVAGQSERATRGQEPSGPGATSDAVQSLTSAIIEQGGIDWGSGGYKHAQGPEYQPMSSSSGSSLTREEQAFLDETNNLLSQTDRLLADSKAQSDAMAQKEAGLKYLESVAGNLDRNERAGYGPVTTSPLTGRRLTDQDLEAQTNIVMGRAVTGADVDTAESNVQRMMSTIFESFQTRLSAFAQGVSEKASPYLDALKSPGTEAQSFTQSIGNALQTILTGAGDTFNTSIDEAVKKAFDKGMSVEIIVKNDRDATLGTVRRLV